MNVEMLCIGDDARANSTSPRTRHDVLFEIRFSDGGSSILIKTSYNMLKELSTSIDVSLTNWERERLKQKIVDEL